MIPRCGATILLIFQYSAYESLEFYSHSGKTILHCLGNLNMHILYDPALQENGLINCRTVTNWNVWKWKWMNHSYTQQCG